MISNEVFRLFLECFPDTENEAEIILSFAERCGEIHETHINGELANIICTARVFENPLCVEYIFACGTSEKHRGKGIFRERLNEITANNCAVLIPENESLFAMYEKMGFEALYCIEAEFGGSGAEDCEISAKELYELYKSCCIYPKKSANAFEASYNAFLSYGNKVKKQKNAIILMQGETASEIFAPDEEAMLCAARACKKALLPLSFASRLDELRIKYRIKKLAAAKNLPAELKSKLFINNLFN